MGSYGLLVVDTAWANNDAVEIDKATYLRHKDQIISGAKALIYMAEPVEAVVAEAEVSSKIIETETEPPDPYFDPPIPANLRLSAELDELRHQTEPPPRPDGGLEMAHSYHVPLTIVQFKGRVPPIPFAKLQTILGSDFTVFDETWLPLSQAQYDQIAAIWSQEKAR